MLVIGNGESRTGIDISVLEGPKVGCNAIMRDYDVDYLVCVDQRMLNEAINRKVNQETLIYTRRSNLQGYSNKQFLRSVPDLPYQGIERWDDPVHWGSGPYAVLIGATYTKEREVRMLGFDLYSSNKKINNVYKDTVGYKESDSQAVDPRYWLHQIGMIFQCFPKVQFKIYQTENWTLPKSWAMKNVFLDKIENIK